MSEDFFRMTSHRPYLLRALVEWINDNELTPHILVDAGVPGVQVPISAVLAVYARETGQGMALPDDIPGAEPADAAEDAPHDSATPADDLPPDGTPPSSPPPSSPPPKGRPTLRVVK